MTLRTLLIDLAVMVAIGLMLALLGPFGSFGAPFALRLLFWLLVSLGGYLLYMPVLRAADGLAARLQLPAAALWAAGWVLATVPMTAVVWVANGLWTRRARPTLEEAAALYGDVLVVAAIACLTLWFLTSHRRGTEGIAEPPGSANLAVAGSKAGPASSSDGVALQTDTLACPPAPKLLGRLPAHLGPELLALEMQDHYVRAHTPAGSALLLLRMRDAVAELDGVAGAQVHRSWWVARAAVTGVARDGRNVRLRLANGLEAPVARAAAPELKAAGWW